MNTVCERVELIGEARSRNPEKLKKQTEHIKNCFEISAKKYGGTLEFKCEKLYDEINLDNNSDIIGYIKKAAQLAGVSLNMKACGGGTDTNVMNGLGIPSVTLSVGYEKMHSKDEYLLLDEFYKAANLVLHLFLIN